MSTEADFDSLVKQLTDTCGMSRTGVAQLLGYASNPKRSFEAIVGGTSEKHTITTACKVMQTALTPIHPNAAAPARTRAEPTDVIPGEVPRFRKLIKDLEHCGVAAGTIAAILCFSGNDPEICFKAIIDGYDKAPTLSAACATLANHLHRLSTKDDVNTSDEEDGEDSTASGRSAEADALEALLPAAEIENVRQQAKKTLFGLRLQGAVGGFKRKDSVPAEYVKPTWPTGLVPTLSAWYRIADGANVYFTSPGAKRLRADREARAKVLAEGIVRAWPQVKGEDGTGKVRAWLMDGAGYFFFEVIRELKKTWTTDAELDARLELSLVDWNEGMNDYHACAIPCATVRRGNIHKLIADRRDTGALPHVVYYNFSITTTGGTTKGEYDSGSWPGSDYSTTGCMTDTAESCQVLLSKNPRTHLMLSFSGVRGGKDTIDKMNTALSAANLTPTKVESVRRAFLTYTISSTRCENGKA